MTARRLSKQITNQEDLDFIFNATEDDCCKLSFMMECFGEFGDGKRRFNTYDTIIVPPGTFGPEGKKNKNAFITTVGIFVFNRAFIERELMDLIGYTNEPITKKTFGKMNKKISFAVIEDRLDINIMKRFILKTQKFQPYCNILSYSFDEEMLTISSKIRSKRDELFEKYKEGIENKDPSTAENIEKELLKYAKELLKDSPSMDMIDSGAKFSWGNNFKNMFIMRGAYKMSDTSKGDFDIIKGNFADGVTKEEYAGFADSLVGGPYARAKKTEVGGALEKQFVKAFQHLVTGPEGSDCGTKKTYTVLLTDDNVQSWMYSYIVDGNKLVELTSQNMDQYIGKEVKFRYSIYCEDKEHICHKCSGNLFHRLGISAVGIASYAMCSQVKLKSMKAFHDSTIKMTSMEKYGYGKIFDNVK